MLDIADAELAAVQDLVGADSHMGLVAKFMVHTGLLLGALEAHDVPRFHHIYREVEEQWENIARGYVRGVDLDQPGYRSTLAIANAARSRAAEHIDGTCVLCGWASPNPPLIEVEWAGTVYGSWQTDYEEITL